MTISFVSIVVILIYFGINWNKKEVEEKGMSCMVWLEDHYEAVTCKNTKQISLSLNKEVIESFRKVQLDTTMTLFKNGKGLFWYSKIKGEVEFFTNSGIHPVHRKKLSPITQTIVRKYVYGEE